MWYRVFGFTDHDPDAAEIHALTAPYGDRYIGPGEFQGDEQGWFAFRFSGERGGLELNRYLATEEGIRRQMDTWAAWLESQSAKHPQALELMPRIINTRQVFTIAGPEDGPVAELCRKLCALLARRTDGVYQVDRTGFFSADGALLVPEWL
jgi:hypothetical protein